MHIFLSNLAVWLIFKTFNYSSNYVQFIFPWLVFSCLELHCFFLSPETPNALKSLLLLASRKGGGFLENISLSLHWGNKTDVVLSSGRRILSHSRCEQRLLCMWRGKEQHERTLLEKQHQWQKHLGFEQEREVHPPKEKKGYGECGRENHTLLCIGRRSKGYCQLSWY